MTLPAPAAGQFEGRAHLLPVRVYYEDTDFTGLVYHGAYVRWFERGRTEFLRSAGVEHAALLEQAEPLAFAVTRLEVAFRKGARIDDALVVRTAFEAIRGPRLSIAQAVERDGEPLATAEVEVACIGLNGRARRPTAALVAALKPWLAAQPAIDSPL
jgi:acyl-CoA thioester hydrolase